MGSMYALPWDVHAWLVLVPLASMLVRIKPAHNEQSFDAMSPAQKVLSGRHRHLRLSMLQEIGKLRAQVATLQEAADQHQVESKVSLHLASACHAALLHHRLRSCSSYPSILVIDSSILQLTQNCRWLHR